MSEIAVDARWETVETTNDDDGKLEFRDVYTRVTLDPIAASTFRMHGI